MLYTCTAVLNVNKHFSIKGALKIERGRIVFTFNCETYYIDIHGFILVYVILYYLN